MAVNSVIKFELMDGSTVTATLNFARLKKLANENKELWKRYTAISNSQPKDELEFVEFIYIAYVCANLEDHIDIDEFFELMPVNREEIVEIYMKLQPRCNPKN